MLLILVLVTTPVLAAFCATSCASEPVMKSMKFSTAVTDSEHCHEKSSEKNQEKLNLDHKSCVMGFACYCSQVISYADNLSKYVIFDLGISEFPKYVPFDNSIGAPPPTKPPV